METLTIIHPTVYTWSPCWCVLLRWNPAISQFRADLWRCCGQTIITKEMTHLCWSLNKLNCRSYYTKRSRPENWPRVVNVHVYPYVLVQTPVGSSTSKCPSTITSLWVVHLILMIWHSYLEWWMLLIMPNVLMEVTAPTYSDKVMTVTSFHI